jgi:hypothetical protein
MRLLPGAIVVSMALAAPVGLTGAASATPSHWETGTLEIGPEVIEDFCGVSGLTVDDRGVGEFRFRITKHGPDGFSYAHDFEDFTETLTNVDTGEFVTVVGSFKSHEHRITDNGDGTLTVLSQGPGEGDAFNSAGERISHTAGLSAVELLYDHGGTPTDPSDDEFLEFLGFVKSTGHDDDFCGTMTEALG